MFEQIHLVRYNVRNEESFSGKECIVMRLEHVCITNFKGIKNKEIKLQPGFNLIIGENGTGKTSILEAMAVGLGGFITGFEDVKTRHFSDSEIRCVYSALGDGSYNRKYETPIEVVCGAVFSKSDYPDDVSREDFVYHWKRAKSSVSSSRTTVQPKNISYIAKRLANADDTTILPAICYQGAGRVWAQKKEKMQDPFAKSYFRTLGYADCLTEESNVKMLQNWCIKMEHIAWQRESKIAEYEAVKAAVGLFMSKMEGDNGKCEVFYDRQYEALMFRKNEELHPISSLSAGYQSLIWMVFDIAYRMAVLNPQQKDNIMKVTPGVILIDELDLHLHPKWQWNIIEALSSVFPKLQFIATTHSPILIAAAKDAWIIDVTENAEKSFWKQYGFDVNETLKIYQDSLELPMELAEVENKFELYMSVGQHDRARKLLEDIEEKLGNDIPYTINMRVRYELETAVLGE